MRSAFLRSDSVETVTLEAIGATTASVDIVAKGSNKPGVELGDLTDRIDAVLKTEGASTDPAVKDMTGFLKRVGPDLRRMSQLGDAPNTEYWHSHMTGVQRNATGPAEELFKRRFQDSTVPAEAPQAATTHKTLTNRLQVRA